MSSRPRAVKTSLYGMLTCVGPSGGFKDFTKVNFYLPMTYDNAPHQLLLDTTLLIYANDRKNKLVINITHFLIIVMIRSVLAVTSNQRVYQTPACRYARLLCNVSRRKRKFTKHIK